MFAPGFGAPRSSTARIVRVTGVTTTARLVSGLTSTMRLPEAAMAWPFGAARTTSEASSADDRPRASGVRPGREVRDTVSPG
jgi:hypothetical protein